MRFWAIFRDTCFRQQNCETCRYMNICMFNKLFLPNNLPTSNIFNYAEAVAWLWIAHLKARGEER